MIKAKIDLPIHYWPKLPNNKSQIVVRYYTDGGEEFVKTIWGEYNESKESLFAKAPKTLTYCDSCRHEDSDLTAVMLTQTFGSKIKAAPSDICRDCMNDESVKWRPDTLRMMSVLNPN